MPTPGGRGNGMPRDAGPPGMAPVQLPPPRLAATAGAQAPLPGPPPVQPMNGASDFQDDFQHGSGAEHPGGFPGRNLFKEVNIINALYFGSPVLCTEHGILNKIGQLQRYVGAKFNAVVMKAPLLFYHIQLLILLSHRQVRTAFYAQVHS